jgi:hypothetical protein
MNSNYPVSRSAIWGLVTTTQSSSGITVLVSRGIAGGRKTRRAALRQFNTRIENMMTVRERERNDGEKYLWCHNTV